MRQKTEQSEIARYLFRCDKNEVLLFFKIFFENGSFQTLQVCFFDGVVQKADKGHNDKSCAILLEVAR